MERARMVMGKGKPQNIMKFAKYSEKCDTVSYAWKKMIFEIRNRAHTQTRISNMC